MSEQLMQEHATKNELGRETKEKRDITASISGIDETGITVDVTTDILRAEATLIENDGEEQKVLEFDEDHHEKRHIVPFEDTIYAEVVRTDYWQLVEQLRGKESMAVQIQQQFDAWELLSLLHRPTTVSPVVPSTGYPVLPPDTVQKTPLPLDPLEDRFFHITSHSHRPQEGVEYRRQVIGTYRNGEFDHKEHVSHTQPPYSSVDHVTPVPVRGERSAASRQVTVIEPSDAQPIISYTVNTDGENSRLSYLVSIDSEEQLSVKDTLLALVVREEINATIVKQPFYSPESFDDDGTEHDAGWQDGFYSLVQLNGMDMDMTEFSVNGDLAMDGIDSISVTTGDYIEFESADDYLCGAAETVEAYEDAWLDRYGVFDQFDSVTERGVYAAMIDGNVFEGSPLDLSLFEDARTAYMDHTGDRPEDVLTNVFYSG